MITFLKSHDNTSNYYRCAYISGGRNSTEYFGDIWRINLQTKHWSLLYSSSDKKFWDHSAAVTSNGQMLLYGGVDESGTERGKLKSVWLDVKPLVRICMNKLLKMIPAIRDLEVDEEERGGFHGVLYNICNEK